MDSRREFELDADGRVDVSGLPEVDVQLSMPAWASELPEECPHCGAVMDKTPEFVPDIVRWTCPVCRLGGGVFAPIDCRDVRYMDFCADAGCEEVDENGL